MYYLTQSLHRNAQLRSQYPATIFLNRQQTWGQLIKRVARLAGVFQALGIRPNRQTPDRIAILSLNSDRYLESYFATWWAGAAIVPLNIRWSADEHSYALKDSQPHLLLVDDQFAPLIPTLRGSGVTTPIIYIGEKTCPDGMLDGEDLIASHEAVPDAYSHDDQLAGIFYTGGTTGFPKGVMLSHANLLGSGFTVAQATKIEASDRYLHAAPMFHIADIGGLVAMSLVGVTHIIVPAFVPDIVLDAIATHRVTHAVLVPTMIKMAVDALHRRPVDCSSLQQIIYGASPITEQALQEAMQAFPTTGFLQAYGQTEYSPVVSILSPDDHALALKNKQSGRLRSAGQATICSEICIRNEAGAELLYGEVGEVTVKGPGMMMGYWNKPLETAQALQDGWLHTGDAGYLDEEGFLFIVDRLKDMIITGGENVFSTEVENTLAAHPAVSQAVVIGIPDPTWGENVHAIVILRPDTQATADQLREHCQTMIAGYKSPRSIEFRTEPFPLSGAGKILKRELRLPFWAGKDRMVN